MEQFYNNYLDNEHQRSHTFETIPSELLFNPIYFDIPAEAKWIYVLLWKRYLLSQENRKNFTDEEGYIFIYMNIEEISNYLGYSKRSIPTYLQKLEEFGLIRRKRRSQKSTKIYVLNFMRKEYKGNLYNKNIPEPKKSVQGKDEYGTLGNILLSDIEYEKLENLYGDRLEEILNDISMRIYQRTENAKPINNFLAYILEYAKNENILTEKEIAKLDGKSISEARFDKFLKSRNK